ncbi:MAG: hypothetical protein EP338_10330 [Bacteroidetes bacterium]|nr:MAG: hypothetical protein EP338_10330 [Bacteroidota bacterium]
MEAREQKPLQVLSASAGSGKTFNLVRSYLRLVLAGSEETQSSFQSILAMTFTNKASSEMKSRIVQALHRLTNPETPSDQNFLSELAGNFMMETDQLRKRARRVLKQILHRYEDFHVLTIDKFNLRLIRSFARDLNINSDFQTSSNEREILSQLVDQLFQNINEPGLDEFTNIALRYSRENLEEGLKWDFKTELKDLSEILTKEHSALLLEELLKSDFSVVRYDHLKQELGEIEAEARMQARKLYEVTTTFDPNSFPGGSRTVSAFERLKADDLFEQTKYEAFFSPALIKSLDEDGKSKSFDPLLKQQAKAFCTWYEEHREKYFARKVFRSNFFNIALLQFIASALDAYKKTDNIVLISEFNRLISSLLNQEEAAFIYERIGTRYQHFLLDEFQDTSHLQWLNLIPLVHNSLASGQSNLIVGDPKQSIYRFKNGLAEQFVELPGIYNPENDPGLALKSRYFQEMGELVSLNENWRSGTRLVDFNNRFFEHFKETYPQVMEEFYKDLEQYPKSFEGGYVYFESREVEEQGADLSYLLAWVKDCLSEGYDPGDICVLGYTKKECNDWANYLSDQGYKVVSVDSLLLGSDAQVQLVLAYFKWQLNPVGELEARIFSEKYFSFRGEEVVEQLRSFWKEEDRRKRHFDIDAFLSLIVPQGHDFFPQFETLYQLFQHCCKLIGLKELNNPYLHQLGDYLFQFDLQIGPDLALMIEHFESEGAQTAVQIPENREAIKVMTGHKSKGLEFPVVMVPSLSWNIVNRQSKYLLKQEDFFFYSTVSKNASLACMRAKYEEEFQKSMLDKINLNYVIFTRARERLYVVNMVDKKKGDYKYQEHIHKLLQQFPGVRAKDDAVWIYVSGEPDRKHEEAREQAGSELIPKDTGEHLWFPDISLQELDLIRDHSLSEAQRYGKQLHLLLASLDGPEKIPLVLESKILSGEVEELFKKRFEEDLHAIFEMQDYRQLFEEVDQVLREQEIILAASEHRRPDLILIKKDQTIILDYKTGMPRKKDTDQLRQYVKALQEMGLPGLQAYLFYVSDRKLEQVA